MLNKLIKNKINNPITIFCLIFVSLTILFPAGSLSPSSTIERTSQYIAEIAENNTKTGKYVSLMIEPNDNTDKRINDAYYEFHSLYAVFREGLATYVGTANADKNEHSIKIKEFNDGVNFSVLNVDSGFGVKEYYKDREGNMVYKQEFYPLELMFYSNHPAIPGAYSFLYLSKSRATQLLDLKGLEHSRENYHSLLNQLITIEIDETDYFFAIDNIYLEQNYFYDALHETIGEFFLAGQKYPPELKRQAMFFLRNFPYQNKYFIEYATQLYPQSDFDYKILDYNFKNKTKIDNSRLIFFSSSKGQAVSILLTLLSVILLLCSLLLITFGGFSFKIQNHLLIVLSMLIPYLIFWIIHLSSNDPLLFSNYSTTCFIWFVIAFTAYYLVLFLLRYRAKRGKDVKIN